MRSFKRTIATVAVVATAVVVFAVTASGEDGVAIDSGRGERLVLVIGGTFNTREEAEAASTGWMAEELEGFSIAPSDDFEALRPGNWVLVSAFRTTEGAAEFEDLAAAAGFPDTTRVLSLYWGDAYIGLGQEAHPDGSGPLTGPLPDLLG